VVAHNGFLHGEGLAGSNQLHLQQQQQQKKKGQW
jgi:hypothetical protein